MKFWKHCIKKISSANLSSLGSFFTSSLQSNSPTNIYCTDQNKKSKRGGTEKFSIFKNDKRKVFTFLNFEMS